MAFSRSTEQDWLQKPWSKHLSDGGSCQWWKWRADTGWPCNALLTSPIRAWSAALAAHSAAYQSHVALGRETKAELRMQIFLPLQGVSHCPVPGYSTTTKPHLQHKPPTPLLLFTDPGSKLWIQLKKGKTLLFDFQLWDASLASDLTTLSLIPCLIVGSRPEISAGIPKHATASFQGALASAHSKAFLLSEGSLLSTPPPVSQLFHSCNSQPHREQLIVRRCNTPGVSPDNLRGFFQQKTWRLGEVKQSPSG